MLKKEYISTVALFIAIVALGVAFNIDKNQIAFSGSTDDYFDAKGGFKVNGTTVIDSSGNVDAPITSTTGTFSGGIVQDTSNIIATTTLTSASDNYQFFAASADQTTVTLPAAADGLRFVFVVTGALTGPSVTIDSAEGDNINGILMVNDADVVCEGEDQIDIVTDGEVIGDRVELISDGTSWFILDSDVDAAGKMTCTDPS